MAAATPAQKQRAENSLAASLKDSLIGALIAFALAGPLVGLRTVAGVETNLVIVPDWVTVAAIVAVVFVARLLLNIFLWRTDRPVRMSLGKGLGLGSLPFARIASPLFLALAIAIPIFTVFFAPDQSRYVIGVGTLILTYIMLGWGLNIVVGLAGLLDLGYVAFYAVGAYSYALISDSISAGRSGCACRSPAFWPRSGA